MLAAKSKIPIFALGREILALCLFLVAVGTASASIPRDFENRVRETFSDDEILRLENPLQLTDSQWENCGAEMGLVLDSSNPVNFVDPDGQGKIRFIIETVKGIKRFVSKNAARRCLKKGGDVDVVGSGSSKEARNLAKEKFGKKTVRHDPHQPGQKPHYQKKTGGGGHVKYTVPGATAGTYLLGDNAFGKTLNFFNPLSDVQDVVDLADELGEASGKGDSECEEKCQ